MRGKPRKVSLCKQCGEDACYSFVWYGNLGMRCIACRDFGPITSWIAVAPNLSGRLRAFVTDERYEAIEQICEGEAVDCLKAIQEAAYAGKLVQLVFLLDDDEAGLDLPISSATAQAIVLRYAESEWSDGERFAIQSCQFSPRRDHWVVCCNREDYVLWGRLEREYIGVGAYVVNASTGALEVVSSLGLFAYFCPKQDDEEDEVGDDYLLQADFDRSDKRGLINLRQQLECRYEEAFRLLSDTGNGWLTGRQRVILAVQEILAERGVRVRVALCPGPTRAVRLDKRLKSWDEVKLVLRSLLDKQGPLHE